MNNSLEILDIPLVAKLIDTGRYADAEKLLDNRWPDLCELLSYRRGEASLTAPASDPTMQAVLSGWRTYYMARYSAAVNHFKKALESASVWIQAWSAIGIAKVATDTGYLQWACEWISLATALARQYEMPDHHAAAQGALGELLLRADYPAQALDAFELDAARSPP